MSLTAPGDVNERALRHEPFGGGEADATRTAVTSATLPSSFLFMRVCSVVNALEG